MPVSVARINDTETAIMNRIRDENLNGEPRYIILLYSICPVTVIINVHGDLTTGLYVIRKTVVPRTPCGAGGVSGDGPRPPPRDGFR